ncbi:hypothetical protein KKF34_18270 [Myxococcota bacterium]|nr:hypothetical protein [Myxococcota bacterium]
MKRNNDYIWGSEYDWPACDKYGYIGIFLTAGGSYAPLSCINNLKIFDLVLKYISKLPQMNCYSTIKSSKDPSSFFTKGCFIYDGDFNGGPYSLEVKPSMLLHIDMIDPVIKSILKVNCFRSISFHEINQITKSTIIEDIEYAYCE